jgi:translocation and assembly module TamB
MKRRHLVVLVSAATLLVAVFIAVVTIGLGVGTDTGRDTIRSLIQQQVGGRINGKLYLGKIGGGFLTGFTVDSFAIRGADDSLFVSTGRIKVDYDLRDLLDRRILLRNVEVDRLFLRLNQFEKGDWNHERIFRRGGPKTPNAPGSSFGDYVVLENVRGANAQVVVAKPWHPPDSLTGTRRDSAIAYAMSRKDKEYRRTDDGFKHVYRWTKASAVLPRVRIADPDSTKFGMLFTFERLNVEEQDPPFSFRNVRGNVRKLGDSLWLQVPHFDLPASTGSATGKVWWGSHLPTRLDIRVRGDSVALNDVAWVYPTFPRTGSGKTDLRITNYPGRINDFQYELTNLDARSNRSRVTGAMTFISSGPVLQITDVDAVGAPVNFDLLRTFAGAPLPVDWQGDLWGYVKGPGGPLTDFVVSESDVTFRDAHVSGAVTRGKGRGALNILDPEFTVFKGFEVKAEVIDTRSLEFLFPSFPRIHGTIAGSAVLDSIWTDVRFSNADMTHRNMPGEPSRVTGSGRVTYGELMTFDVSVIAQPVSLTMMSAAYDLGIKGLMSGPIRARGTSNDMQVTAQLEGPAGRISYSGRADAYPLSVAARGGGRVDALDLSQFVDAPGVPGGFVTGTYQVDVRYDTTDFSTITGMAAAQVERAELDSIRVFPSRFRARFAQGQMLLDTLRIESAAATVTADGVIGLKARGQDSIRYAVAVDSLGGLRRYVSRMLTAMAAPNQPVADSLSGKVTVTGTARGALAALDVKGSVDGSELFIRRDAGRRLTGSFAFNNLFAEPSGALALKFDTLNVGVIRLDTLGVVARLESARRGGFAVGARATNGVTYAVGGDLALADSSTQVVMRELTVTTDSSRWALQRAAPIQFGAGGIEIDSLAITNGRGGSIALEGFVPDTGKGRVLFRADSVSLRDISAVTQMPTRMAGWAHFAVQGGGTSAAPIMNAQARLNGVRFGTLALSSVVANAFYSNRRADVELDIASGARPELLARASVPLELRYLGVQLLDDSLHGTLRTDSGSVQLLEMLLPISSGTGRLIANLDLGGTLKHPDLSGPLRIENGEATVDSLGIRLRGINVDIALFGHQDSLHINRFTTWSGASPADAISLGGFIKYRDLSNPVLSLQLVGRTFRAIDRRDVSRLDISTTTQDGLRLTGPLKSAVLRGNVQVDRGVLYLPDPELARKQIGDVTTVEEDLQGAFASRSASLLSYITFDNVTLTLGEDVFLRSRPNANDVASIKLVGTLTITKGFRRVGAFGGIVETPTIFYDGVLRAERGTYSLALEPTGFVRKDFQVEGGTVTLQSNALGQQEGELNISAIHTLRTANGDDLRVRARLLGDYNSPTLVLESGESFAVSQSDLVSYLLFGQPNFEVGAANQEYIQTLLQTLAPTLSRGVRGVASRLFGSTVGDALQVQTAVDWSARSGPGRTRDIFSRSRLGAETRIGNTNVFVSVSTPLCFGNNQESENDYFINGLSGKIEWRLSRDASVQAGREPSALVCGRAASGRVVATPAQWGVSVLRSWRF